MSEETAIAIADASKPPRLQSVEVKDGVLRLAGTIEEQALVEAALGQSVDFHDYCLRHLLNLIPEAEADNYTMPINAALAMIAAINPRDELEAMLAVQMVASNHMALMSMRRSNFAETVESRQMNGNLATKFSRTFTAQMEALSKHRRGGKQIVEHVHVNQGGQAVFADTVVTGGGGR